MQARVIQLAETIVESLKDANRLEAIDALDVARVLLRNNPTLGADRHESAQAQQESAVEV
jgi:hypothetical protein